MVEARIDFPLTLMGVASTPRCGIWVSVCLDCYRLPKVHVLQTSSQFVAWEVT